MMNEMIERVARVLSPQSWQALGTPCDTKAKKKRREVSMDFARRCIQAMREPIEAIKAVNTDSISYGSEQIWQAMIDAALKDD